MFFELIILCIAYLLVILIGSYYAKLFITKDSYTREELKSILPFLKEVWKKTVSVFSIPMFIGILFLSIIAGIIIPMLITHWIVNSALLVAAAYFGVPYIKSYFEKSQVSESEDYSDKVESVFVKYAAIINLGFGLGYGSALMYNWSANKSVYFLWFLINIIIITFLLGRMIFSLLRD